MWMSELPPFVTFFLAALLPLVTRGTLRAVLMLAAPLLGPVGPLQPEVWTYWDSWWAF